MMALALLLTVVIAAIALLHGYWAAGGLWPSDSPNGLAATVVGRPGMRRMPSASASWTVAAILAIFAAWPLLIAPLAAQILAPEVALLGSLGLAAVFLLRGVAGYLPVMTKRHSAEPFARYNRRYYSPLCLALGAGFLILALNGGMA